MGISVRRSLLLLCLLAPAAAADDAFVVNGFTSGAALLPSVDSDASGNFVIVWQGKRADESSYGVFGRRYDAQGAPLGPEFRVNTYTTGSQTSASVAMADDGRFVVAWFDAQRARVEARRYAADGTPAAAEFQVNSYTTVTPTVFFPVLGPNPGAFLFVDTPFPGPTVAADPDGDFMVAWDSIANPQPCPNVPCAEVQARRFNAAGVAQGPQFQVSAFTTPGVIDEAQPSVAAVGNDHFVVVWNANAGSIAAVAGWDSQTAATGQAFIVGSYLTSGPTAFPVNPIVSSRGDGSFVAVWNQFNEITASSWDLDVRAQRFATSPAPNSAPGADSVHMTPVLNIPTSDQNLLLAYGLLSKPWVSVSDTGASVVTWPRGVFESGAGVTGRHLFANGSPNGSSFPIDQSGVGVFPVTTNLPLGAFVTAWTGADANATPTVLARRIGDATPPLVKVTFPNAAGVQLPIGIPTELTWTATDADGLASFEVFVSRDGGATYDPSPVCASLASGASPYACTWTVTGPATTHARVKVVATSNGGAAAEDVSDADATLANAFVTMTVPDTDGVAWAAGKTHQLRFIHNLGKGRPVLVEINRDYPGGAWETIPGGGCAFTNEKANSGCTWLASGVTNGPTARIRVSSVDAPAAQDTNNAFFEISSRVRVTAPNTAVKWKNGSSQVIRWTHNYGVPRNVDISLDVDGDGDCDDLLIQGNVTSTATGGNYAWTVAGAGSQNRICVRANPADPDGADVSDSVFTILP